MRANIRVQNEQFSINSSVFLGQFSNFCEKKNVNIGIFSPRFSLKHQRE